MVLDSLTTRVSDRIGELAGRAAISDRLPAPLRSLAARIGGSCRVDAAAAHKRAGTTRTRRGEG